MLQKLTDGCKTVVSIEDSSWPKCDRQFNGRHSFDDSSSLSIEGSYFSMVWVVTNDIRATFSANTFATRKSFFALVSSSAAFLKDSRSLKGMSKAYFSIRTAFDIILYFVEICSTAFIAFSNCSSTFGSFEYRTFGSVADFRASWINSIALKVVNNKGGKTN